MRENYIKCEYSETWLEGGVVIQVIDKKHSEITLPMAKQLIKDRIYAAGGDIVRPVLVEVNNAISTDKEAKQFYKEEDPYHNISAIAMVMDNFIARTIGSLIFKLKKNAIPIEFFNKKESALEWLSDYIQK